MKRVLSILVMTAMLMTSILPVMAEEAVANPLDSLTRASITKVGYNDATMIDDLMLEFDGITFTSSDPAIINPETGKVTRGDITKNVILTAHAGDDTKEFSFRVPGRFDEVGGAKPIPQPAEMIYTNDFSGTTFDAHTTGAAVQDSVLKFENAAGSNVAGAIVPTTDGAALEGKFAYEFVLNRSSASKPVYLYFFGTHGRFLQIASGGGNIVVEGDTSETINVWNDADRGWVDTHNMSGGRMKITAAFDTANNTYDLWINNLYVKSGKSQGAPDVKNLTLQTGSAATSFYIDDLSVYYIEEAPKVFYEDSFDGASLPANVTTPGTAKKVDGGIAAANDFYLNLNDSGSNIEGTVHVDFTLQRPASYATSMGGAIIDATGKKYFDYLWYVSNNAYLLRVNYVNAAGETTYKDFSVGGASATSAKILASIDTETGAYTVTVPVAGGNYESIYGVTTTGASGVAQLYFNDYGAGQQSVLADIKVYGQGTYKKITTFCNETFDGTPNVLNTLTTNLNDSGTDITGEVNVDFAITRGYNYSSSELFSIEDASGKKYADFVWWNAANGSEVVCKVADAAGVEKTASTTGMEYYSTSIKLSVSINTETKAVTIFVNGNEIISGYAHNPAATGVAKLFVKDNDSKGEVALTAVKCYGEGTYGQTPILYHDDFNGSTISNHVTTNVGALTQEGGKLTVNGGSASTFISLNENKTNVSGKFAVETKLTRSYTGAATSIYMGGYGSIVWYGASTNFVRVNYADTYKDLSFNTIGSTTLEIRAEFDSEASTMSVWINGHEVVKDVKTSGNALSYFQIYTHDVADNKPSVEYFTYKRLDADKNRVNTYYESFDAEGATVELTNMAIANGKVAPVDSTATSSAKVYLKEDKSAVTGKFVVELTASRAAVANTTDVRLWDNNGKLLLTYRMWGSANPGSTTISVRNEEGAGETLGVVYTDIAAKNDVHLKFEIDTTDNSFYLWVNGVQMKTKAGSAKLYSESADLSGVAYIGVDNTSYGVADTALLDMKYYEYEEEEVVVAPETRPEIVEMVVDFNGYDEKVTILSPNAEALTVIAAAYAGGKLISAAPVEVTLTEDGCVVADTSALENEGADTVKVMLWSSLADAEPLYAETLFTTNIMTN